MAINRNNFLRWVGSFKKRTYTIHAVGSIANIYNNQDSITIKPLSSSSATNGIDTYSFEITKVTDLLGTPLTMQEPPFWDGQENLTLYRPIDLTLTAFYLYFKFKDGSGNISNEAGILVYISAISVSWVAYPISAVCVLDSFGNNTGYLGWNQLKLVNQSTGSDIYPLQVKDNVVSDPDYIAPIMDLTTCPTLGSSGYAPLIITNSSLNGAGSPLNFITITGFTLSCSSCGTGGTPIYINKTCNIPPGQTARFNVPAATYDIGLSVSYTVNTGGNMDTAIPPVYWKANKSGTITGFGPSGSGLSDNLVTNAGILAASPLDIPANPAGVVIFAQ